MKPIHAGFWATDPTAADDRAEANGAEFDGRKAKGKTRPGALLALLLPLCCVLPLLLVALLAWIGSLLGS